MHPTRAPHPSEDAFLNIGPMPSSRTASPPGSFSCVSFDLGKLSDLAGFDVGALASLCHRDFSSKRQLRMLAIREAFAGALDIRGTGKAPAELLVPGPPRGFHRFILLVPTTIPAPHAVASALSAVLERLAPCDPFVHRDPPGSPFDPIPEEIVAQRARLRLCLSEASDLRSGLPDGALPARPGPRI